MMNKNLKIRFKISRAWILYIGVILTALTIIVRDLAGFSIGRYIFLLIASIIFFVGKIEDIYLYMMFIAPIHTGLPYSFIFAIALISLILRKKKFNLSPTVFFGITLICALEIINGVRGEFTISGLLQFLSAFVIFFLMLCDKNTMIDRENGSRAYVLGTMVAVVDLWGQMLQHYSIERILGFAVRFGNTREAINEDTEGMLLSYNSNMLGGICALCALICLLLIMKKTKRRYLLMVAFVVSSITCFLTVSRAAIIIYILGVILFALTLGGNIKRRIYSVIIAGLLLVIIYYVIEHYFYEFYKYLQLRFQYVDLSNGRVDIFINYLNNGMSSVDRFLIGVGLQGYKAKSGIINSCHNAIEECFVAWGIVGLSIIILMFIEIFKTQKIICNRPQLVNYVPVLMFLLFLQGGQGFSVRGNILSLIAAFSALGIENNRSI